ncbi:PD-(D/E)XK nuclease family protein [Winogradskyella aurantiaca]|uniref:PD-(D/E)XK nuclease family protein n=1 Tax=Winogradskyella aurantiaca TaxID=2219558 RepID=UPI000E1DCAAD|nr:PD-(D/E)XK nuclease family protein [Winogradskyella aurantiaca]
MESFIDQVTKDIITKNYELDQCLFIVPSRRASVFLRRSLSKIISKPVISPEILSIEEFVSSISGLNSIAKVALIFQFYSVYKDLTPEDERQSLEQFMSWAPMIIQDFNEIDRFLVEPSAVFDYLKAIKDIDHWSVASEQSPLIKNHLKFWGRLKTYYHHLNERLDSQGLAYQGMAYRSAVDQLELYISNNSEKRHIFLGFNALNKAESLIIQELLQDNLADIYWDTDITFHNNTDHSAGRFTRIFKNDWPYYRHHDFNWLENNYKTNKHIQVIGIPKQVGQAKYVGQLLNSIYKENPDLSNTAVILGDESLLMPIISSIPKEIPNINITMGLPLKQVPLASLFELLFRIHKKQSRGFYYKDVISLLLHETIKSLTDTQHLIETIQKQNKVYTSLNWLLDAHDGDPEIIRLLFHNWNQSAEDALHSCKALIFILKEHYQSNTEVHQINLEYLFRFNSLFNSIQELNQGQRHMTSLESLYLIYKELLSSESLDFQGEPLQGLQIMGMLESRVLDFETIIITSVNEGILPAGKTQNSMIPYDLKLQYGLPTYKEKDAVYTHHFYRLLQRAKKVYLIYNTEVDALKGGEKSRFISQLEAENIHKIHHKVLSPEVRVEAEILKAIPKTNEVIDKIYHVGSSGFSPSALTKYIRNPIDYYYQYVLSLKELDTVEEHLAANTLGTIIHEILEVLYTPFKGLFLSSDILKEAARNANALVKRFFIKHYGEGNFNTGKNLISFEVAKRYIQNFLELEQQELLSGRRIKILELEHKAAVPLQIKGLRQEVCIKGTVDRIDEVDGELRIIDYKSGRVNASELRLYDWSELITDYARSKAFQLLCYAYIYWKSTGKLPTFAGIISFKNLGGGVLHFGTKLSKNSRTVEQVITPETMATFEELVSELILEILDLNNLFQEKELL